MHRGISNSDVVLRQMPAARYYYAQKIWHHPSGPTNPHFEALGLHTNNRQL